VATIPFIFGESVVVIKNVPAEICGNCHEPFLAGRATDRVTELLNEHKALHSEVVIVAFDEYRTPAKQAELAIG
jgi:YgiT-type zinc finger domain-containing protein